MNNNTVIIKSFPNGISVILNDSIPFSELLKEVGVKFKESASFFKDARMAISFEGRTLTEEEERLLIGMITANTQLHILCLIGKDEKKDQTFLKAIHQATKQSEAEGRFYKGTLKNHEMLEVESSIVVIGDVYPGSSIVSKKDIIIIGGLFGEAYAGADGESGHYVVALEMSPEKLKIGNLRTSGSEKGSKWSIRPKVQPKIAYEKAGKILMEPITKELLNMLPV